MAYLSKKEFCEHTGLIKKDGKPYLNMLRQYVRRKKVVLCDDGEHIDTSFPTNRDFMDTQREKRGVKAPKAKVKNSTKPPTPKAPKTEVSAAAEAAEGVLTLEKQIKQADLQKKEQEIEKLKLQNAKLQGQLIPTELVKSLIREFSEAMKISYLDAVESYTTIVAKQKKLTREEESKIKYHFTALINDTLKKQGVNAKKQLKNIVEDYQEVRGKGERK